MNNVKRDIKDNCFKKLYLFTGPEVFLSEYFIDEMSAAISGGKGDDFNLLTISRQIPDISTADSFINSYPFMSEKKLLIIKNSGLMKKASDEDKKYWSKLLCAVPDYCVIVFEENDIDKRSAIYKAVSANGYIAEFPYQKGQSLVSWVCRMAAASKKEISQSDAEYLISSCNPGMINIKREMEKLISCKTENPKITKSDIDRLVTKSIESKVFEMASDIACGKTGAALKKLEDMKRLNVKPPEIFPAVFSKFSSYRKIKLLSHLSASQIAKKTGQREYFVKLDMAAAKNLSREHAEKIMFLCSLGDYKVKNGLSDGWTELIEMMTVQDKKEL